MVFACRGTLQRAPTKAISCAAASAYGSITRDKFAYTLKSQYVHLILQNGMKAKSATSCVFIRISGSTRESHSDHRWTRNHRQMPGSMLARGDCKSRPYKSRTSNRNFSNTLLKS